MRSDGKSRGETGADTALWALAALLLTVILLLLAFEARAGRFGVLLMLPTVAVLDRLAPRPVAAAFGAARPGGALPPLPELRDRRRRDGARHRGGRPAGAS